MSQSLEYFKRVIFDCIICLQTHKWKRIKRKEEETGGGWGWTLNSPHSVVHLWRTKSNTRPSQPDKHPDPSRAAVSLSSFLSLDSGPFLYLWPARFPYQLRVLESHHVYLYPTPILQINPLGSALLKECKKNIPQSGQRHKSAVPSALCQSLAPPCTIAKHTVRGHELWHLESTLTMGIAVLKPTQTKDVHQSHSVGDLPC